jgi:alkanesulfonate monooxygenase SsuD/methylene tetrahydromethanopterin reductase-like flavin-dependent oxidoreductase (luciferase family)
MTSERIKLATGITSVYSRPPTWLATSAATVDALSGGRFVLGLAVGHAEHSARRDDVERERPLSFARGDQRLREATDLFRRLVRAAYAGEPVDYEGQIFRVRGYAARMTPVRPEIPVWIASLGPRNLAVAGELADAAVASVMPRPAVASYFAPSVAKGASAAGRDPRDVGLVAYVPTCVSDDVAAARRAVELRLIAYAARLRNYRRHLVELGFADVVDAVVAATQPAPGRLDLEAGLGLVPDELLRATTAWGDATACVTAFAGFAEAGTLPIVDLTHTAFRGISTDAAAARDFRRSIAEIAAAGELLDHQEEDDRR